MSTDYKEWIPVCDALLLQAYYRTLGIVSIHTGISNTYQAITDIAKTRGGTLRWIVQDRVARWDNLEIFPGITTSIYIFGSAIRQKNSVYVRVGFWQNYLLKTALLESMKED